MSKTRELVYEFYHRDAPKRGEAVLLFLDDPQSPRGIVTKRLEGADHGGLDVYVDFNAKAVERYLKKHPSREILER